MSTNRNKAKQGISIINIIFLLLLSIPCCIILIGYTSIGKTSKEVGRQAGAALEAREFADKMRAEGCLRFQGVVKSHVKGMINEDIDIQNCGLICKNVLLTKESSDKYTGYATFDNGDQIYVEVTIEGDEIVLETNLGPVIDKKALCGATYDNTETQQLVTFSEYKRIQMDMSYNQVIEIIGAEGEEISRNKIDGIPSVMNSIETTMYQWINSNGSNMNVVFQNDELMQKAQFGLE